VLFFIELSTQWNLVAYPMGGQRFMGINYTAVESAMNIQQIPKKNRLGLFRDLKVMELAALEVLNKSKG